MTESPINVSALEPLYLPWEEPNSHRVRAEKPNQPAQVIKNRYPSILAMLVGLAPLIQLTRRFLPLRVINEEAPRLAYTARNSNRDATKKSGMTTA